VDGALESMGELVPRGGKMSNPFGWFFGYLWFLVVKINVKLHPAGGCLWMPRWIQPYWMRCMGFEVSDAVLASYRENK
jgi:hypothetical protein